MSKDIFIFAGQSNAVALNSNAAEEEYLALTGKELTVYNCAVGGTYIIQHAQEYATTTWKTPTPSCKKLMLTEIGKGNKIVGVAFWQGESDAFNMSFRTSQYQNTWPTDWFTLFQKVQKLYREGINQPNLPFILVKLPTIKSGCYPASGAINSLYWNIIQEVQQSAPLVQPFTSLLDLDSHNISYTCGDIHLSNQVGKYEQVSRLIIQKWVQDYFNQ